MGTLSKRGIEEFGLGAKDRIEDFRTNVGRKIDNISSGDQRKSRHEGPFTRQLEKLTAALPSTMWLGFAGASVVGSIWLKIAGRHATANFVAAWVPTFLMLGLYNKIVKVAGSDRTYAR